jgi:hypothetical protein
MAAELKDLAGLDTQELAKLSISELEDLLKKVSEARREAKAAQSKQIEDKAFLKYRDNAEAYVKSILTIYKRLLNGHVSEERMKEVQDILDRLSAENVRANAEAIELPIRGRKPTK